MDIYYYCVWLRDGKEPDNDKLIVDETKVVARNNDEAHKMAVRAIPAEYADRLGKCSVQVRPFVKTQY